MPDHAPTSPLRFDPSMERPEPDEAETFAAIAAQMRKINEITAKDYSHAVRSVHAKSHGLLHGELRVVDGLPASLAQGLFARAGSYEVVMRLSTNPGDVLDDSVSVPRGLALKVIGVAGERLPGSEGATTQDFVMANAPAFGAANPKAFLTTLKPLAATTDIPQALKKAASAALRGVETVIEKLGGESPTVKFLGGHPQTHILGETFYSQAPLLYGDFIAKLAVAPVSPELKALTGAALDLRGKPNGLREAVVAFFEKNGGEWELRAQLCTDREAMPIEDPSVIWPEDKSPYVAVARIAAPPQTAWSEARAGAIDDGLAFSPWHGLAAHRPLGGIMRSRRPSYEMSARFRAEHNRRAIEEPRSLEGIPG